MRYVQSGSRVTRTKIIASIFIGGISFCLLLYGAGIWFSITDGNTIESLVVATFFYLLFISGMSTIAVYNFWKFPNIVTSDSGLELKTFFFTRHIAWQSVVRTQKKYNKLLIFLGSSGHLLNRLYGMFDAGVWDQPALLFESTDEIVNRLEEDIKAHMGSNT